MKKFSLLFFAFSSIILFAQENKSWTFGAKAGINFATLQGSYDEVEWVEKLEGMTGFHLGGWANYAFHERFALQIEALGSYQGGDIQYTGIPHPLTGEILHPEAEMRLPYIVVPVMLQYKPVPQLYIEAGPQLNLLPKVVTKAFLNGQEVEDDQAAGIITNRLKNAQSVDFGLNLGAGYEFFDKWTLYGRYTHGMITVDKREEKQRDLKNRVIAFGISYRVF
ncbi:MAG: porin family protein [Flavobacteriaceae bacterium]|nr:porin family protein [Flavobacteriaceae bacterium]